MTPIHNRAELLKVLEQASKSVALLRIKNIYSGEFTGTIQFIENGLLDKIIVESADLKHYTKISIADIVRIDSDIFLELNNIVSQNFEVVAPVEVDH
jgi:hypothetical protein